MTDTTTNPTTTAQATVRIPPPPESQEEQMCSCGRLPLIDGIGLCEPCLREVEQWERIEALQHQRDALTEQVRVLRECVEWYADERTYSSSGQPGNYEPLPQGGGWHKPERGERARSALAALEVAPMTDTTDDAVTLEEDELYEVDVQLHCRVRFRVMASDERDARKQVYKHYIGRLDLGEPDDVAEGSLEPEILKPARKAQP